MRLQITLQLNKWLLHRTLIVRNTSANQERFSDLIFHAKKRSFFLHEFGDAALSSVLGLSLLGGFLGLGGGGIGLPAGVGRLHPGDVRLVDRVVVHDRLGVVLPDYAASSLIKRVKFDVAVHLCPQS